VETLKSIDRQQFGTVDYACETVSRQNLEQSRHATGSLWQIG